MTQTSAIIVNALLAVGIAALLAYVMRTPFRLRHPRRLTHAVYMPKTGEDELSRAA
jgi:hypothetical protein